MAMIQWKMGHLSMIFLARHLQSAQGFPASHVADYQRVSPYYHHIIAINHHGLLELSMDYPYQ